MALTPLTPFSYLEEILGKELVDSIPLVESPIKEKKMEGAYCCPYSKFEDLPHDVVKMILPSGRACLVFRYISVDYGVKLCIEAWIQRYSSSVRPQKVLMGTHIEPQVLEEYTESELANNRNWVDVVNYTKHPVWTGSFFYGVPEKVTTYFKKMMAGAPLAETEYRYFPKCGEQIGELSV